LCLSCSYANYFTFLSIHPSIHPPTHPSVEMESLELFAWAGLESQSSGSLSPKYLRLQV
jgi:hypothetical protein